MIINPNDFKVKKNENEQYNGSYCQLTIFSNVNFLENNNYIFDDIDQYLNKFNFYSKKSNNFFSEISEEKEISIKIDYVELEKNRNYNYLKIENYLKDQLISYGYYFVKKMVRSRATHTVLFFLKLDFLNTFINRLHFSNNTLVINEHINRFDFNDESKNFLLKKVPFVLSDEQNLILTAESKLMSNAKTLSLSFQGWLKFFIGYDSQNVYFLPFSNCKVIFRKESGENIGEIDGVQNINKCVDYLALINSNVFGASFVPYDFYDFYSEKFIENGNFVYVVKDNFELKIATEVKIKGNTEKGIEDKTLSKVIVINTTMLFLTLEDKNDKVKLYFEDNKFLENNILNNFSIPLNNDIKAEIIIGNIKNGYFGLESSLYSANYRQLKFKYPFASFEFEFFLDKLKINCFENFTINFPIYFETFLTDLKIGVLEFKNNNFFELPLSEKKTFILDKKIDIVTGGRRYFEKNLVKEELGKISNFLFATFKGAVTGGRVGSRLFFPTFGTVVGGITGAVKNLYGDKSNDNEKKDETLKGAATFEGLVYCNGFYINCQYYKIEDEIEKKINREYYLYGNVVNQYKVPTHNNRRFFDYLKCEPKFINEQLTINETFLNVISEKLRSGVYFIHNDKYQNYIFPEDDYENSENDLITWINE